MEEQKWKRMQFVPTWAEVRQALPGLIFVILPIAIASEILYWAESRYVQEVFHIPAPVIALMIAGVISIVVTNVVDLPPRYAPGMQFATRWLLRIGIVLYGLNFSYALWFKADSGTILLIGVAAVVIPGVAGYFVGRAFGLQEKSSLLIAIGTAVCGISAIVATQQSIKAKDEEAGMSIATILLFGTFVLFSYPIFEGLLAMSETSYGVWTGATTLDLPQLVAAALQGGGNTSLQAALWVKSIRIGLLVPVVLLLVALYGSSDQSDSQSKYSRSLRSFPLFIVAFFIAILINSFYNLPVWLSGPLASGSGQFVGLSVAGAFLTAAIISICFRVKRQVLRTTGWRYIAVGGIAWAIQSVLVLVLVFSLPLPVI